MDYSEKQYAIEMGILWHLLMGKRDEMKTLCSNYGVTGRGFFHKKLGTIFDVILNIMDEGHTSMDVVFHQEVADKLQELRGGNDMVKILKDDLPNHSAADTYPIHLVQDFMQHRVLCAVKDKAEKLIKTATNPTDFWPLIKLIDGANSALSDIRHELSLNIDNVLDELINGTYIDDTPSLGWSLFDYVNLKFWPGETIVVGGRPRMGKSAFALNMIKNFAKQQPTPKWILFFSLEMRAAQNYQRLFSSVSGVPMRRITKSEPMTDADREALKLAANSVKASLIRIIDDAFDYSKIVRIINETAATPEGLGLVVVDYLQLVRPPSGFEKMSQNYLIARISRGFKETAMVRNVPIILLSQLNRDIERGGTGLNLALLRDSGAIEQDASGIILLHRPHELVVGASRESRAYTDVWVAKNRFGDTDSGHMMFDFDTMTFKEANE